MTSITHLVALRVVLQLVDVPVIFLPMFEEERNCKEEWKKMHRSLVGPIQFISLTGERQEHESQGDEDGLLDAHISARCAHGDQR